MITFLYGALLAATVAPSARPLAASSPTARWLWPVTPPVVVRRFEPPPTPYASGHRGIDLAATAGQEVHAAGAGVVSFAGYVAGSGVVVVRHGGLRTTYEPVGPAVTTGQAVAAGQVVGRVSGSHLGCEACLHFGLRLGKTYLDPMLLYGGGPVRLLPVGDPVSAVAADAGRGTANRSVATSLSGRPPDTGAHRVLGVSPEAPAAAAAVTSLAAYGAARRRRSAPAPSRGPVRG